MSRNQNTTKSKLVELKKLHEQAGGNIYQRCRLASEILKDVDFIASEFGDEGKARDNMEADFFSDLRGYVSLGRLLELYKAYPSEKTWRDLKYDLAMLEAKYVEDHAEKQEGLQGHRTSWKKVAEELQEELERVRADHRRATTESESRQSEVVTLRDQVRRLELENADLKGRLAELERVLGRQAAA